MRGDVGSAPNTTVSESALLGNERRSDLILDMQKYCEGPLFRRLGFEPVLAKCLKDGVQGYKTKQDIIVASLKTEGDEGLPTASISIHLPNSHNILARETKDALEKSFAGIADSVTIKQDTTRDPLWKGGKLVTGQNILVSLSAPDLKTLETKMARGLITKLSDLMPEPAKVAIKQRTL